MGIGSPIVSKFLQEIGLQQVTSGFALVLGYVNKKISVVNPSVVLVFEPFWFARSYTVCSKITRKPKNVLFVLCDSIICYKQTRRRVEMYLISNRREGAKTRRSSYSRIGEGFLLKENGISSIWTGLGSNFQGPSHEQLKQCYINYMNIDDVTHLQNAVI